VQLIQNLEPFIQNRIFKLIGVLIFAERFGGNANVKIKFIFCLTIKC